MADTSSLVPDTRFIEIHSKSYVLTNTQSRECIVINLESKEVTKQPEAPTDTPTEKVGLKAVYGICELEESSYLIAVTQSFTIGSLYNKNIQQLREVRFFPINPERRVNASDEKYIEMMQSLFDTKMFYFSDEYDLTTSFQRFIQNQADKNHFNENFCYNRVYLNDFVRLKCNDWITPFISGYVQIDYTLIDDVEVQFAIVSRRDKRRAGMRFISRGTDEEGNPSNMAEQEQIVVLTKNVTTTIYSFVQTRGSMPFSWSQKPDLKWAPRGLPHGEDAKNIELCRKHFQDQEKLYPRHVLLNLIDKKGRTQLPLGQYFEKMVSSLKNKNLNYIWFDFHAECKNMKYENLQKLIDLFAKDLDEIGYFEFSFTKDKVDTPTIKRLQKGTIRTNCMDCLDRTNVVQSVVARNVLHKILCAAGVTEKTASTAFEKFTDRLEDIFRATWTRNADVISILYTGTGALKTDFTRTGKRTKQGAIQDGVNSVTRYFYGNFFDAHKQDCLDVLLGKIQPKSKKVSTNVNPVFFLIACLVFSPLFMKSQINNVLDTTHESAGVGVCVANFVAFALGMALLLKSTLTMNQFFIKKPTLPQ